MSEEIKNSEVKSEEASKEEFVSKKTYEEVSKDMHKYKRELKEMQAKLAEFEVQKTAMEEQKLIEQNKFKELYEKKDAELKEHLAQKDKAEALLIQERKKFAVNQNVKFKKSDYINFVNLNEIQLDEQGLVVQESVKKEVQRIQQQFPELLENAQVNNIPNRAAQPLNLSKKVSQDDLFKHIAEQAKNKGKNK